MGRPTSKRDGLTCAIAPHSRERFVTWLASEEQLLPNLVKEELPTNRELSREGLNRLSLFRDFKSPAKTAFG